MVPTSYKQSHPALVSIMIKELPRMNKSATLTTRDIRSFQCLNICAVLDSLETDASKSNPECDAALKKEAVGGLTLKECTKGGLAQRRTMNGRPWRPILKESSLANGTSNSYLKGVVSSYILPRTSVCLICFPSLCANHPRRTPMLYTTQSVNFANHVVENLRIKIESSKCMTLPLAAGEYGRTERHCA